MLSCQQTFKVEKLTLVNACRGFLVCSAPFPLRIRHRADPSSHFTSEAAATARQGVEGED
eukprot:607159-Rhodomonas_salina.1